MRQEHATNASSQGTSRGNAGRHQGRRVVSTTTRAGEGVYGQVGNTAACAAGSREVRVRPARSSEGSWRWIGWLLGWVAGAGGRPSRRARTAPKAPDARGARCESPTAESSLLPGGCKGRRSQCRGTPNIENPQAQELWEGRSGSEVSGAQATRRSGMLPASVAPESEPAGRVIRALVRVRRPEVGLRTGRQRASLGPGSRPAEDIPEAEPARKPILARV